LSVFESPVVACGRRYGPLLSRQSDHFRLVAWRAAPRCRRMVAASPGVISPRWRVPEEPLCLARARRHGARSASMQSFRVRSGTVMGTAPKLERSSSVISLDKSAA
jgi:hypothetical protein